MANEKTEEFTGLPIEQLMAKLNKERSTILENFTRAYLAETGLMPSQVEFVTQQMPVKNGVIENVYFFRKKENV